MEGMLGVGSQQGPPTPFSPEALRTLAEKERAEKELRRTSRPTPEEPPPGAPLKDVSVANPLRYLLETGISRSRENSDTGGFSLPWHIASGMFGRTVRVSM